VVSNKKEMIKNYTSTILLFISFISYGQKITKGDFQHVIKASYECINLLKKSDFKKLSTTLKLSDIQDAELKLWNTNRLNEESVLTAPHFFLTDNSNEFQMVIVSFKTADKLPNETFNRGVYFIVVKSRVKVDTENTSVSFSGSEIIIDSDSINAWWLSQYKTYVTKAGKVYELFGYIPPPPSPPPLGLK